VLHSFSGNAIEAQQFINLGMMIGISGIVTFKNNQVTRDVVSEIDLKYLIIETDCPFLTPVPYRGKRNEPAYTKYVALEIAKIKDLEISTVDEITQKNTEQLFKI